jgi:hypothetical protein
MTDTISTLDLNSRLRQHPDQVAAEADGEVLMMHIDSGNYFGLNEVASFLWKQLDTAKSVRELCDAVLEVFDVGEEACVADALNFLRGMLNDGLIEKAAD